ncbi:major facilitator superfamily domain-containing protein [Radiomyces spectabilis]|uniref:major facilitator superfamily domain-containing protein n=1 Tax=Radiomyces spectabilis TaxID=64574 RepID=UPI002220A0C1|nr:major facilitator superfamily domain-containing protein [Radiomyces spectabilis]KAI8374665.1 major facilitator superfamily domain-containing protein [Radiomyces spectabilis]
MVLGNRYSGTVLPADVEKKANQARPRSRLPFLLKFRSSNQFIFCTAAIGLFTSTFVHSILFPLAPFIVSYIKHGTDDLAHADEQNASTSSETGILVAAYAIGLLVGSPIFGWLGDKTTQRRLPMLLGITASLAANVLFMFSIAYWMLLSARFLQGVSNACVWTMCLCLIADNWPIEQLGLQMGKLIGFYPLGMVLGLPAGVLYSKLGYQAPFIASIILCGLDFIMRLSIIERTSAPKEWFQDATSKADPTLSMRLAAEWEFDAARCGLILLSYMVPCIASSAFCGWLCDKYGTKIVALVSLVLVGPTCVAMGIPDRNMSFWTLVPILMLGGMTIAGCQAPVFPEIAQVVAEENEDPNDRNGIARSYALVNAAYAVGLCVGPLLAGYVYGQVGFFWLCFILAMIFVICIPLVYFYMGGNRSKLITTSKPSLTCSLS